ncbi:MAG TPA: UPF0262 family protein [Roseiarcus sp.]|nr:UPF0262 family protein [Roseiarcus sp.]
MSGKGETPGRLVEVTIDEASIGRGSPDQEHERAIAIYDLVQENRFSLAGRDDGPYALRVALQDAKLTLAASPVSGGASASHTLPLTAFRSFLKDYFLTCETYYAAIRTASPAQIEALDNSRRVIHDEAAALLLERLAGKIDVDFDTARRLFTLIVALHWKA